MKKVITRFFRLRPNPSKALHLLLIGLVFACRSEAAVRYVDIQAKGSHTGVSWTDAFTDLQDALSASSTGDEIWIAAGLYLPAPAGDVSASFVITRGVSLYGGFAGHEVSREERAWSQNATILSGDLGVAGELDDNAEHVVTLASPVPCRLDGLVIRDGGNPFRGEGAGVFVPNGFPTPATAPELGHILANCTLTENHAVWAGGAIELVQGSMLITNCNFVRNSASFTGGAILCSAEHVAIKNCTFLENTAGLSGGAVGFSGGFLSFLLENSLFRGNQSDENGGALSAPGNQAAARVLNCVFDSNQAGLDGGAIYSTNLILLNSTLYGNEAPNGTGGGVVAGQLAATNSIFWQNTALLDPQIHAPADSAAVSFSDVQGGFPGEGNFSLDPLFVLPSGGDFHLQAGSPAIDKGNTAAVANLLVVDLDGNPRISNGTGAPQGIVDLGPYEYSKNIVLTSILLIAHGGVTLEITAPAGGPYQIERADALGTWTPIGTSSSSNGRFQFTDSEARPSQRFYRVKQLF